MDELRDNPNKYDQFEAAMNLSEYPTELILLNRKMRTISSIFN